MEPHKFLDPNLTPQDRLVLENLLRDADVDNPKASPSTTQNGKDNNTSKQNGTTEPNAQDQQEASLINHLESMNDPKSPQFDPTIFVTWDTPTVESSVPAFVTNYLIRPYTNLARRLVRVETDVVMLTHLLIYFSTSVPSALYLYLGNFTWTHGILHWAMQTYYVGTFTLMMHQHIHMGGILSRRLAWLDTLFPYLLYPLMGHTWNSYYYHHVKHHHIEGNGPDDISSTIFYQRDSPRDLACYVGRFLFLVWFELPTYFVKRGRAWSALKAAFWELGSYALMAGLYRVNPRATVFVLILPFVQLRLGLMVGNWGQHAFVDEVDPDSDFRSSTTLVDVAVSLCLLYPCPTCYVIYSYMYVTLVMRN